MSEAAHVTQVQPRPLKPQVVIWENDQWINVDRESRDFPIMLKLLVQPEWAEEVLRTRNARNRPITQRRVDRYTRDILTGNFKTIHSGVAFYEDGTLADGQHRLRAIVEAKVPVVIFIAYGLTPDDGAAIDEGRPRSDRDVAHLSGLELSSHFISTANFLLEQMGLTYTRQEKLKFYDTHKDAINFVCNNLTKKFVARAPVMAAIVKAYYSQPRTRLIEFIDVLNTGLLANPQADESGYRLREFCTENGARNDGPFRTELYQKTKSALNYFINGKPMMKLFGIKEELYVLPEEEQMRKEAIKMNRSIAMKAVRQRQRSKRTVVKTAEPGALPTEIPVPEEQDYGG